MLTKGQRRGLLRFLMQFANTLSAQLDNMTAFDNTKDNPLDFESYDDLHADDDDNRLGSLGGGGEFSTGETGL